MRVPCALDRAVHGLSHAVVGYSGLTINCKQTPSYKVHDHSNEFATRNGSIAAMKDSIAKLETRKKPTSRSAGSLGIPYFLLSFIYVDAGAGRTVAVTAGSTAKRFARAINRNLADTGQPLMNIHAFPDQRYTHVPASIGHAVAYFVQTVSAVGVTQDPDARLRLVEGTFQPLHEVDFGVPISSDNIWHALEHAVAATVATGKYERLRTKYGLPTDLSP